MKYGILFAVAALLLMILASIHRGWFFLLIWPGISFAVVASGYFYFGPSVYGKSARGLISPTCQLLLLPYLLYAWSVWYAVRLVRREPAFHQLTERIFIGRRLLSREVPNNIDHVIDLTCEFNEPKGLRSLSYHSCQILDGFVPSQQQLHKWAAMVSELRGNIYIHCAEGHGRTGLFAAVLLLETGHSQTVHEALRLIVERRPLVRLGKRQLALLHATRETR